MRKVILFCCGLSLGFLSIWFLKVPSSKTHSPTPKYTLHIGGQTIKESSLHEEATYNLLAFEDENLAPEIIDDLYKSNIQEIVVRKSLIQNLFKELPSEKVAALEQQCEISWSATDESLQKNLILKDRFCEEMFIRNHFIKNIDPQIEITEQSIRDYYDSHISEFKTGPRVLLRHILVKNETLARKIHHKLRRGNFEALARKHSIAPEADQGGLLGPFTQGELPSTLNIAFQMKKGGISQILSSTYGYHMITLEKKFEGGTKSFEEARLFILNTLLQQEREKEYRRWLQLSLQSIKLTRGSSAAL